ncbi:MAG TPA: hypothetical protein VGE07_29000 [Herpetosiphonaceae bacterium]
MTRSLLRGRGWPLPLALFCGVLALYAATLTRVHTFDAYSYAMAVQTKPWPETFHPHHLAYGPLGELAYGLARRFGYGGSALLPLQLVNALAGAAGVALWSVIIRRATDRPELGLLGGALLAGAYAFWYYAVEIEVYTLAALFLIAAFGLLLELARRPGWAGGWLALGLAHSGAILFHQTNVLWAPVALAGWALADWPQDAPASARRRALLLYAGTGALLVGGAYAAVMLGWSGFRSWAEIRGWLFEYAATGFWGGPVGVGTLRRLGQGWGGALLESGGGLIWLGLLALVAARWRAIWRSWRLPAGLALLWLIIYALFFAWWEADNIEFWIAALPPASLLALLALASVRGRPRLILTAAGGLLAAALLAANAQAISRRGDQARDEDWRHAAALAAAGDEADLYLVPNGMQELYLRYEHGRSNVLALSVGNGDWAAGCAQIQRAIAETVGAGYRAWIDPGVSAPPPELLARYRLQAPAVAACFAPFAGAERIAAGGTDYAVLQPAPAALPDWSWEAWSLGWRPNNLRGESFAGGWEMEPGDDPHLVSPPLSLEAGDWRGAEVTMSTTIPGQRGQLYWISPGGQADERHSIAWELIADGEAHTYRLDLAGNPAWSGPISLLRLDPVAAGASGDKAVVLRRFRLTP